MKFHSLLPLFALSILFCCSPKISNSVADQAKSAEQFAEKSVKSGLVHTVYFWYVEDADKTELANFENELQKLGKVPSIQDYYYGPPAKTEVRGPVDNTFDMAINVFFKDVAGHDAYQIDPIHLAFVDKNKHLWDKVIVYDNEIR